MPNIVQCVGLQASPIGGETHIRQVAGDNYDDMGET